jgi:hypothetical protein
MSLGSRISEPVDGDARSDESEGVSVQIGENSFAGDEEVNGRVQTRLARTRAIDLWD